MYVTRFEKIDHVCTTSQMHFVASYHRYIHTLSKHGDKITRGGQIYFSTWLMQNTEMPVQIVRDFWGALIGHHGPRSSPTG